MLWCKRGMIPVGRMVMEGVGFWSRFRGENATESAIRFDVAVDCSLEGEDTS